MFHVVHVAGATARLQSSSRRRGRLLSFTQASQSVGKELRLHSFEISFLAPN